MSIKTKVIIGPDHDRLYLNPDVRSIKLTNELNGKTIIVNSEFSTEIEMPPALPNLQINIINHGKGLVTIIQPQESKN